MKNFIRRWLGIYELEITTSRGLSDISDSINSMSRTNKKLRDQVQVSLVGIGRVLAKLEPILTVSEDNPERKAESDRLGETVIKRLLAENSARHHTFGDE